MGPYQRTPKKVARAIRYSGLGVRSVGPVGDFLDPNESTKIPPTTIPRGLLSKSFWIHLLMWLATVKLSRFEGLEGSIRLDFRSLAPDVLGYGGRASF